MKPILKLTLLMISLLAIILVTGCGKNDFTGTWIGYNDEKTMYRLNIQENGDSYLITQDAYTYKPEKDYPVVNRYLPTFTGESKQQNVTFDINFILTKEKTKVSSASAQLNKDKDQLIVGQGAGNIYFIEKDDSLLFNGIRFKKESTPDVSEEILKSLQVAMKQELEVKYHAYGSRNLNTNRDKITLGNITFNNDTLSNQ